MRERREHGTPYKLAIVDAIRNLEAGLDDGRRSALGISTVKYRAMMERVVVCLKHTLDTYPDGQMPTMKGTTDDTTHKKGNASLDDRPSNEVLDNGTDEGRTTGQPEAHRAL
jgi:hypothetical protein